MEVYFPFYLMPKLTSDTTTLRQCKFKAALCNLEFRTILSNIHWYGSDRHQSSIIRPEHFHSHYNYDHAKFHHQVIKNAHIF